MEKNDKDNCPAGLPDPQVDNAPSPEGSSSAGGEVGKLFRRMTDTLYECLSDENICDQRVPFGRRSFCKWLLRKDPVRTEDNIPCVAANKPQQHD